MRTVDAKGKLCPQPLIMTKKALMEMEENETLKILLDNKNARFNVARFLKDNGMEMQVKEEGSEIEILVAKQGGEIEQSIPENYCEIPGVNSGDYAVCLKKTTFGDGDQELGEMLMKGFLSTLPHASALPKFMILVNSGIFLALKDSPVLESLKELEQLGVEILICGTCTEFYNKNEELAVGKISNMLDLLEKMISIPKILNP